MATFVDNAAAAIAQAANWRQPEADTAGTYVFSVQEGLEMRLFSPDGGNTAIFCATIQTLPEAAREAEEILQTYAQRAVAVAKKRRTTLALEGEKLVLQHVARYAETPLETVPGIAKDFLNDLAWWRQQAVRLAG